MKFENASEWLLFDLSTAAIIALSVMIIFSTLIVITRISGLRTFAKMTSFDFATTIAIGSILATISIDPKVSITNGAVALVSIIAFQVIFALIQRKSEVFRKTATNKPVLLMTNGKILEDNLANTNLHRSELIAKLREANVLKFEDVKAVVLESTGDVSVLHGSKDVTLESRLLDFLEPSKSKKE
ncbi:DUF421 domain-containing protein [Nonlabens marinus]|uniref:YetF C-terminal domain-containing protein n=1 Tax=Nonlabens marinus S1-08 TaxID=1454201 RepID=W8VPK4_9FLAO|nr:YetF domain-containing protein [Nonlabens marinus]BAO54540.1 conserved hypothetical protein-putative membrane protein [Nonlabens marinus S1-08]